MYKIEDIDQSKPVWLVAYQHDLDCAGTQPVDGVRPIILQGCDAIAFIACMKTWRKRFEECLQCLSEDERKRPLLTTWMPLCTFREDFCNCIATQEVSRELMDSLRTQMRPWRSLEVDEVDITGYANAKNSVSGDVGDLRVVAKQN